ncbi:MAG TPA: phosphoglycerate mutase family protein [Bacillota bacterium]|nr:phosphoglycerate mutase family protein [Bacillota bacterium]
MGKIHLIRHGTTEGVKARVYYGSTDLPLTNEGIDLISGLAAMGTYPKADGAYLYTTGLLRTEQTFFLIYGCRDHFAVPELKEYDFGEFEMKTHNQLIEDADYQSWIGDADGITPCPSGESRSDFSNRITKGFTEILEKHKSKGSFDGNSIVVCHGGVISQIMRFCFPDSEKNLFQWVPDPGRGYTIHIDGVTPVSFDEI